MRRLVLIVCGILISIFMAGCSSVVPVVPHAIPCHVPEEVLSKECASPGRLADNATFTDLVDQMRADRKALQECGINQQALRDSINACNKKIDEFNRKVDDLNAKNK